MSALTWDDGGVTAAGPERSDDGQTDVDAAFAAIVAGLGDVQWTHTPAQVDAAVEPAASTLR